MDKSFVISTTTALALGYAAGFATDGLTAKASKAIDHEECIEKTLGAGAVSTLETFLEAQMCPLMNAAFDVDDCSADDFHKNGVGVRIRDEGDGWVVESCPKRPGTWTEGSPE